MRTNPLKRVIYILLVLIIAISADQLSKSIVRKKVNVFQPVLMLHNHFVIEKVENTGAFLSLGDSVSKPMRIIFLNIVPLLLIGAAFVYVLIKPEVHGPTLFAILLMIGGGIGNIYDRILHGSVTDFMYIDLGGVFHTGVFNVADMCITAGISIILLRSWFKKKPHEEILRAEEQPLE